MPKRRIFIAIQIPEELKNAAEFYMKPFFSDKNIRIPKKEGWHITLLFCGYLDDGEVEALVNIVKSAASKFGFLDFAPRKIIFAPLSRPRMIWLSFDAPPQFGELKTEIENTTLSYQRKGLFGNFRLEKREPKPHLTLGRFDERHFVNIKDFIPKGGIDLAKEVKPFVAEHVDIMESRLSRAGAEYEIIESLSLNRDVQAHSFYRN